MAFAAFKHWTPSQTRGERIGDLSVLADRLDFFAEED